MELFKRSSEFGITIGIVTEMVKGDRLYDIRNKDTGKISTIFIPYDGTFYGIWTEDSSYTSQMYNFSSNNLEEIFQKIYWE